MTYLLLHQDHSATLLSDDPIVPAAELPAFRRSLELLAGAEQRLASAAQEAEALTAAARDQGFAEGRQLGEAAAAGEVRTRLFDLEVKAAQLRTAQRAEAARLAIEVVRRIAGEMGSETMVSALAEKAASDLAPDTRATVRVSPAAQAAVAERLARFDKLTVTADSSLTDDECVVETSFGVIRAGLETQLAAVERAWMGSTASG